MKLLLPKQESFAALSAKPGSAENSATVEFKDVDVPKLRGMPSFTKCFTIVGILFMFTFGEELKGVL